MQHPFVVGGRYRNRNGEYEVIRLAEPRMVIRYSDGQVLEADVRLQAQIWQNIQIDRNTASQEKEEPSPHAPDSDRRKPQPGPDRRGYQFRGLQESDFQPGVAGTSWRAQENLGGLLARLMSDAPGHFFRSYAIYRRAEVHIVRPADYIEKQRWQEAKFFFCLSAQDATYGFYIEKNHGPMDNTWDWVSFIKAIRCNGVLQQRIQTAMRQLDLRWDIYVWAEGGLIARVRLTQEGLKWAGVSRGGSGVITWSEFVERLADVETTKWCNLYLCTSMDKSHALDAGIRIASSVAEVYRALLPLYAASIKVV